MSRILITGSADGLGKMAAQLLVHAGHKIILHGRDPARSKAALNAVPGAETVVTGDLSIIGETISVADQVNKSGSVDAVIHNAAIGYRESRRINTPDGLSSVFAVNSLSPYILTCLVSRPKRLVYISSGLHQSGDPGLKDLNWNTRPWSGYSAYADSKLHNVILAFAVARKWQDVWSNALEPGWVATKMGGAGAPDSLEKGCETQAWLAEASDPDTMVSGQYFYHKNLRSSHTAAKDEAVQERFLAACEKLSGIKFPA